ncbi:MAG: DUF721 domain-containing protein [Ignavibacterium album]|jgi:hypothetical protein|uniref:DUF721 domain-containing protein n=1 Tax=Ignavibacterium album TaxID=591197 RepID=UPI0026EA2181|nr:DUF721 domain-containing protein [Ignavibacterium album]MCX8106626.1 DUF721 domain-containing protein [Ignavibacterium album]
MPDSFKSLKEIIESTPELKNIKQLIDDGDIIKDFDKIFPELKALVKAIRCSKQVLTLKSDNPAVRNELKFREKEIIEKINSFYKQERITRIKFSNK